MNKTTPSEQCKQAGLSSLAELVRLSKLPKQTLIDWHKKEPRKFELILKGVVYELQEPKQ
ncbi:MAG: hypothetical protein KTR16_11515 [Acidiferrobacterales bacterium]|nr:hypothetical protein [Acidiferrobacterales bacterium]